MKILMNKYIIRIWTDNNNYTPFSFISSNINESIGKLVLSFLKTGHSIYAIDIQKKKGFYVSKN